MQAVCRPFVYIVKHGPGKASHPGGDMRINDDKAGENRIRTTLAINEYAGKVFTAEFATARDLAAVAMASEVHVELTPRPLARSGLAR
jgi:hypothetical protein